MQSLLGRLSGARAATLAQPGESVFVGVCGKHPSEEDHFSDYPPGAVCMADVMRHIYTEGIKANFESGAWKQLPPEKRIASFDHVFVWTDESQIVAGRMWPSTDRVGRSDYPIIYCAELHGAALRLIVDPVLPELERLESRCRAAQSRVIIRAEMEASQERLRAAVSSNPGGAAGSGMAMDGIVDCAELGPRRQGLYRVLYRIASEAPQYLDRTLGGLRGGGGSNVLPTLHLRVPLCGAAASEGIGRWAEFLRAVLAQGVSSLLVMPVAQQWLDIVVGPALAEHMYFLMAANETLATEVPYPIDGKFTAQAEQWIRDALPAARAGVRSPAITPRVTIRPPPVPKLNS